ncbi:MAG: site-specific integrase [Saprospiraceae bacterium]|nr:site-specific integrase [Saprospiraceae bacterium]
MTSIKAILHSYEKQDGLRTILMRITNNRKVGRYPLGHYIKAKDFESKKGLVKKSHTNHLQINHAIKNFIDKAEKVIFDIETSETTFSFQLFEELFFENKEYFNLYFKDYLVRKNFGSGTHRHYLSVERKFKQFVGANYDNLMINDIDFKMLNDFQTHLSNDLKNATNTVTANLKKLCSVLNDASLRDVIKQSPCSKLKYKYEEGQRDYLNQEELQKLENYYNSSEFERIKKALKPYLFSCYTGLSYIDVKNLKFSDIDGDMIRIIRHKTSKPIMIPLSKFAKVYIDDNQEVRSNLVFPKLISNQKINDYLKVAADHTGIKKNLTFHTSRHTFATISLSLGIPIEYVKDLLGHSSVKVTEIYAKIIASDKKEQMLKWNNLK